jgi:hypothetical protein
MEHTERVRQPRHLLAAAELKNDNDNRSTFSTVITAIGGE